MAMKSVLCNAQGTKGWDVGGAELNPVAYNYN